MLSRVRTAALYAALVCLLAGSVPLAVFAARLTDRSCCPDGHACCSRAHHHSSGAQWQAEGCSSSGCCVPPATSAIPVHAITAPVAIDPVVAADEKAPLVYGRWLPPARILPDLFQRPPPRFA